MEKMKLVLFLSLVVFVASGCKDDEGTTGGDGNGEEVVVVVGEQSKIRSCEMLLKNTEAVQLDRVVFSDAVEGFAKKRGDYTAIAFVAKADAAIATDAVTVHMTAGEASALEVDAAKSKCFDGDGAEIADTLWTL